MVRISSVVRYIIALLVVVVIVFCYRMGFESPVVFDDHNILTNMVYFDHAMAFDYRMTRELPYFSIGLLHILSGGDLVWNRMANVALHALVALALYCFIKRALSGRSDRGYETKEVAAVCMALWFAFNPVAVYGTGYLIQRSIVMATLFGLVSATLYLRAHQENRTADVFSAALLGALAMMSKEHAVFLPLGIAILTPLVVDWDRQAVQRGVAFLALSLPCMVWAILHRGTGVVGASYEHYAADVLTQISLPGFAGSQPGVWLMSIATQCLLFWKYLVLWWLPNPVWMSADMRVDFDALWGGWFGPLGVLMSFAVFVLAVWAWWRSGRGTFGGQLATALLYVLVLFCVEFSVVRVQEPFVLYRSFLWMPGYALMLALLLVRADQWVATKGIIWRRLLWGIVVVACFGLVPLAQDRLRSFSSEEALWRDAEVKLLRPDVAGADRIYYNLAGEAFKRKDYATALEYSDKVIRQNPKAFHGYLARGTSLLAQRNTEAALVAFDAADEHNPPPEFRGYIEFKRCGVYSVRGEKDEAIACLRRSAKMGYEMAKFQLRMAGLAEE